ncbi:hypothetical protein HPP92_019213 [Vanilla planifolia]|uniref:Uncharacterized protein n=1 Tax=Vanilla planifolia TaxID=51239 RepID=A0A835Q3M8_VANPL|nr:hypothetical protein HPP92_019213 [Vanilla planifolia]
MVEKLPRCGDDETRIYDRVSLNSSVVMSSLTAITTGEIRWSPSLSLSRSGEMQVLFEDKLCKSPPRRDKLHGSSQERPGPIWMVTQNRASPLRLNYSGVTFIHRSFINK